MLRSVNLPEPHNEGLVQFYFGLIERHLGPASDKFPHLLIFRIPQTRGRCVTLALSVLPLTEDLPKFVVEQSNSYRGEEAIELEKKVFRSCADVMLYVAALRGT